MDLTEGYNRHILIQVGRGYIINDKLGPDFKYFINGLSRVRGIDLVELHELPAEDYYRVIGSVNMDEYDVVQAGRVSN